MLPPIIEHKGRQFYQMYGASRYYLSKSGAVYSTHAKRLLKISPQSKGYPQSGFYLDNGLYSRLLIHRLVALHFVPNPDPKRQTQVNHKNGIKRDCRADNLEWVTAKGNDQHARANHPRYQKKRGILA